MMISFGRMTNQLLNSSTLQSLRFVFVMLIVMSHIPLPGLPLFGAGGDCGVTFFFMLSGFALTLRYGPQIDSGSFCLRQYYWRRLIKIYPLHLLCLAAWLIASHSPIDSRVIANLLLVQSWIPDSHYYFWCNAPSWFLSTLLFSYAVFPWACRHASVRWLLALLACGAAIYAATPPHDVTSILYVNPLVRFVDFALGMALAKSLTRRPTTTVAPWAEYIVVAALIAALLVYPITDAKLRNAPLFWIVLLPLIGIFACSKGPLSRLLGHPWLQSLGRLSLPIFMTHLFVIPMILTRLPLPPELNIPLAILTTILVSWAIDRWLLSPIVRLSEKR